MKTRFDFSSLPPGSIAKKEIRGKNYFYYRWTENGKRKEKYIPFPEVDAVRRLIEKRKGKNTETSTEESFHAIVLSGDTLRTFCTIDKDKKKRHCIKQLEEFLSSPAMAKTFILYGLRRTGKTTMIRQAISGMSESDFAKAAYIQIQKDDTMAELNKDLKLLFNAGFRYVFIDEVTMMEDFIDGSAVLSDVFAVLGMKIVLSGTDSLGFIFTEDEQLYDRCILLHTTFISYREFEEVLGIDSIDEYIRYGGTMSLSGVNYNTNSPFSSTERTNEYVDSAIARNIEHSLKCYQAGRHFHLLEELYNAGELTNAVNRVVEDINHRFTIDVLTRDFYSSDLALSARNLRKDRTEKDTVLDDIDRKDVTERLKKALQIINETEQSIRLNEDYAAQIRDYLKLIDLIKYIPVKRLPDNGRNTDRCVICQPGLRYSQANALIDSLMEDSVFSLVPLKRRTEIEKRIRNEIRGRMLEDIILLETSIARPECQVFTLLFPVGEFDMVVFDKEKEECEIYEIKYSATAVKEQYRHLMNEEKRMYTQQQYGRIIRTCVLYRGENTTIDNVCYQNVEDYLKGL